MRLHDDAVRLRAIVWSNAVPVHVFQSAGTPSTTVVDSCLRQALAVMVHNSSFVIL